MIASLGDRKPEFVGEGQYVAPNASVIGTVRLKANASVWFSAVLRGDNDWIEIGEGSNIQDGCVLHTDPGVPVIIGDGVTVGHMVMLHGCTIGHHSLIGMGSTILNGATIGANCIVGAHSLITEGKTFPDGVMIVGSPAKVLRELRDHEFATLRSSASVYVKNGSRFSEQLDITVD